VSAVGAWWLAVMRELNAMPKRMFPDLPIEQATSLKLAKAMDAAREKGAIEAPGQKVRHA